MKNCVLIFLLIIFIGCGIKSEKSVQPKGKTEIVFNEEILDFGVLKAGEIVIGSIEFTNNGEHDLFIEKIDSDCGCIKTSFPENAISPGEKGRIEVEFNSSGLMGKQYKTIQIVANCKEPKHLAIFAEVQNENLEIKY